MVTIAAPIRETRAVPHTTAVSAVAVLRGQGVDAVYPIKVVVPWEHLDHVSHVSLTFRVPRGFQAEVVLVEPANALCERRVVEDDALDGSSAPLASCVEVVVSSDREPFPCGIKYTDRLGGAGAYLGGAGETLAFQAYSRLYAR